MLLTDKQRLFASPSLSELPNIAARNVVGIVDVTATTEQWFQTAVNQLIKHAGNIRADELTPQLLRRFQTAVSLRATNQTANNYIRAIKTIYNRLLHHGIVAHNPAQHIPSLPEPPNYPRAVMEETYEAMRKAVTAVRDKAILDLCWVSGCRVGELQTIRLNQIEMVGEEGLAFQVLGKGEKIRYIYAKGSQAQTIIHYIQHERPQTRHRALFLTQTTGAPLAYHTIQHIFKKAATGLPPNTITNAHGYRHAAAIRWLDEGVDLATVSQWLGHSDPAFTAKVYCVRTEQQLRAKYFQT